MTQGHEHVNPKRAQTIAAVLGVLPATKAEIGPRAGLNKTTVLKVMPELHKAQQVHIGAWKPHPIHGPPMAIYHAGPGKDVPDTLPRLTKKQRSDRYEKRIKGTEKHDQRKARHRSRHWEKKAKATKKGWAAALGV
jgi:hypothetical protein